MKEIFKPLHVILSIEITHNLFKTSYNFERKLDLRYMLVLLF
jgi:hypothetical protein